LKRSPPSELPSSLMRPSISVDFALYSSLNVENGSSEVLRTFTMGYPSWNASASNSEGTTQPMPSTEPLPEEKNPVYYIVGTVTEKGDGYIKVDDSIMMKNPEDGLTFTIDVTDKKLGRVCNLLISVGDHVLITYDGRISEDGSLLVENAESIQEAWITEDGDVLIPE
jgi:hypothetical protein